MEENNRKGPGVFYAVVGVATLVVAIIGATFAYFSASAESGANAIQGQTLDISSTDLEIAVDKVDFAAATVNTNLAPALVGTNGIANPAALQASEIQAMVNANCEEANKYTGCHVWRITATNKNTTDAITHANIWLNLSTAAADKDQWGYAVFTATETMNATESTKTDTLANVAYPTVGGPRSNHEALTTAVTGKTLDLHNNAVLAADSSVTYYLLVFLNDDKAVQNAETPVENTSTDARGQYSGSVTFEAMGGEVRASFTVA